MPATRPSVHDLSAAHAGVVTQAALVAAGYHHTYAHDETRRGRWTRLAHGVYLTGRGPASIHQRCQAGMLHAGPLGVITGAAGLELRGIPVPREERVTVLVPYGTNRPSSGIVRVVRTRLLPDHQLLRRSDQVDLVVADPDRCVADAIRDASTLQQARAVATSAVRDRRVDWAGVAAARRRGPGAGHLARVVREVADGVRSPAEAEVHEVLLPAASHGRLPSYLLNPDVYVDGVLLGSPDVWFPGLGLGDEIDSREWHEEEDLLDRTLLRHQAFDQHGLALNHVTPTRFRREPQAHLGRLYELVDVRRALAAPEPAGLLVLGRGPLLPARTPWPQVEPHRWR
jgi:hypothetical protein